MRPVQPLQSAIICLFYNAIVQICFLWKIFLFKKEKSEQLRYNMLITYFRILNAIKQFFK